MLRVNSTDAGAHTSSFSTSFLSDLVSVLSRYAAAMFSLGINYIILIHMFSTGDCLYAFEAKERTNRTLLLLCHKISFKIAITDNKS